MRFATLLTSKHSQEIRYKSKTHSKVHICTLLTPKGCILVPVMCIIVIKLYKLVPSENSFCDLVLHSGHLVPNSVFIMLSTAFMQLHSWQIRYWLSFYNVKKVSFEFLNNILCALNGHNDRYYGSFTLKINGKGRTFKLSSSVFPEKHCISHRVWVLNNNY